MDRSEDPTPPGGVTPSQSIDDANDLRSEILRSRLLQLYLAKVMVPSPNNDTDECSSMRVEDDESDYNDRHALFDRSPDVDIRSLRSPVPRSRGEPTVPPVEPFVEEDEENGEVDDQESDLPIIAARRKQMEKRRLSLDSAPSGGRCDVLGDKPTSSRALEVRRITRYLQSDRRSSLGAVKRNTESILEGGDLAVSPEQRQWLEADLHSARIAAWRSELGLRQQISRRGSLHDEKSKLTFTHIANKLPMKSPSTPEKLQPSMLASPVPSTPEKLQPKMLASPVPPTFASGPRPQSPKPPKPPKNAAGEKELKKRREINVYAPVSF